MIVSTFAPVRSLRGGRNDRRSNLENEIATPLARNDTFSVIENVTYSMLSVIN
jgi:hypothetical protein